MTSADSNPWGNAHPAPPNPQPSPEQPILKPNARRPQPKDTGLAQAKTPAKPPLDLTPDPMTAQLQAHLELWQKSMGWQPSTAQLALFQQLYAQLLAGNRQINLTRITDPDEFWEKHLWDSLSGMAPWIAKNAEAADETTEQNATENAADDKSPTHDGPIRVIDIGTGAGFPGIPAAIALSPITPIALTLLDSTRKKIQFLQLLTQQLNIQATCIAERAETLGQQKEHREQYDLALIRAVGPAATCIEYAMPFLKLGGQLVLFRGQWSTEDTDALMPVVDLLGGEITDLQSWKTPLTQSTRNCIFIYKDAPTPSDFPRAVGVPAKKPLT